MATSESQRRTGRDPISPLTHPMRRRILRYLHRCGEPRGLREVAAALGEEFALINYHLKSLANFGTISEAGTTPGRGSLLYESTVSENPEALALLEAHKDEDEGLKKAA